MQLSVILQVLYNNLDSKVRFHARMPEEFTNRVLAGVTSILCSLIECRYYVWDGSRLLWYTYIYTYTASTSTLVLSILDLNNPTYTSQ